MKEGSKREEVGEEEKKKRREEKKKKLILDKSSREDEATFSHPPPSCRRPDSARLPKLCLDLNRSRLEKYLLSALRILQKYFTDHGEYFSRVTSILSYAGSSFSWDLPANTIAEIALRINTRFLYDKSTLWEGIKSTLEKSIEENRRRKHQDW